MEVIFDFQAGCRTGMTPGPEGKPHWQRHRAVAGGASPRAPGWPLCDKSRGMDATTNWQDASSSRVGQDAHATLLAARMAAGLGRMPTDHEAGAKRPTLREWA